MPYNMFCETDKQKHANRQRQSAGALNEGTNASDLPLAKVMCLAIMLPRVVLCAKYMYGQRTLLCVIVDVAIDVYASAVVDSTQRMSR